MEGKKIPINFDKEGLENLERWKEDFGERTYSKTINRLLKARITISSSEQH